MSTISTYNEFLVFVAGEHKELLEKDPSLRYGQTFFNCLWEFRPEIANKIRATKHDPFHLDEVHPATHVLIEMNWEEYNRANG